MNNVVVYLLLCWLTLVTYRSKMYNGSHITETYFSYVWPRKSRIIICVRDYALQCHLCIMACGSFAILQLASWTMLGIDIFLPEKNMEDQTSVIFIDQAGSGAHHYLPFNLPHLSAGST